jgi:hypothetical protein
METTLTDLFSFACFVLTCLVAAAVCICTDPVIGHWLLSAARKYIEN